MPFGPAFASSQIGASTGGVTITGGFGGFGGVPTEGFEVLTMGLDSEHLFVPNSDMVSTLPAPSLMKYASHQSLALRSALHFELR